MVHPAGEEKKFAHRTLVVTARRLAEAGYGVLRFDLSGCGDSSGRFVEATLGRWHGDIDAAMEHARRAFDTNEVGLLGVRLGANLAWGHEAAWHVLWEPIERGSSWVKTLIRKKMMKEMIGHGKATTGRDTMDEAFERDGFIDVDGYALSKVLHDDLMEVRFDGSKVQRDPTLWLQVRHNTEVTAKVRQAAEQMNDAGGQVETRAVRFPPFWDRLDIMNPSPVVEPTMQWLSRGGDT